MRLGLAVLAALLALGGDLGSSGGGVTASRGASVGSGIMGKSKRAEAASDEGGSGSRSVFRFPPLDWAAKRGTPELVELGEGVFCADGVLSENEIKLLCEATRGLLEPTNPRNLPPKRGMAFRNNDRLLQRDEDFAAKLWKHRLEPICKQLSRGDGAKPTHVNAELRIYRQAHHFAPMRPSLLLYKTLP